MSAQNISGLADVIRQAKSALAGIPSVAADVKNTTASVLSKVKQVQALVGDLKSAEAELDGVLQSGANGGPPLEASQEPPAASADTLAQPSPVSDVAPERLTVNGVLQT